VRRLSSGESSYGNGAGSTTPCEDSGRATQGNLSPVHILTLCPSCRCSEIQKRTLATTEEMNLNVLRLHDGLSLPTFSMVIVILGRCSDYPCLLSDRLQGRQDAMRVAQPDPVLPGGVFGEICILCKFPCPRLCMGMFYRFCFFPIIIWMDEGLKHFTTP